MVVTNLEKVPTNMLVRLNVDKLHVTTADKIIDFKLTYRLEKTVSNLFTYNPNNFSNPE